TETRTKTICEPSGDIRGSPIQVNLCRSISVMTRCWATAGAVNSRITVTQVITRVTVLIGPPGGISDYFTSKQAVRSCFPSCGLTNVTTTMKKLAFILLGLTGLSVGCARAPQYDVVIRHGTVYDGSGAAGVVEDVAVNGDRIGAIGTLGSAHGRQE